ncbi:MAG: hemerythrin domain-containing protein [Nitrospira sp. CR2.1]|nr:hemerythrin domain-containing protein [Nitrospira sp. CR2.1]
MTEAGEEHSGPITTLLAGDHQRLDGLLRSSAAAADQIDQATYDRFRAGLLRHIGMEEKLLLPAVQRRRGGDPLPVAAKLRLDHGALATLLMPTPTPQILATIRRILSDHNRLEEGPEGLYALCDRLPAAEMEPLLAALRAAPLPIVMRHSDSPAVMKTLDGALARAGYRLDTPSAPEVGEPR